MAKVEYADAIKTVSGALTKINKKSPHAKDQKMVLATHRSVAGNVLIIIPDFSANVKRDFHL